MSVSGLAPFSDTLSDWDEGFSGSARGFSIRVLRFRLEGLGLSCYGALWL